MLILSDGYTQMIKFQLFALLRPGFVSSLSVPKIPEGEKVDFDVSSANSNVLLADHWFMFLTMFHLKQQLSGHSPQAHGEGPDGTPNSDRGSFWEAEEGGRGAPQPHRSNRTRSYFSTVHWNVSVSPLTEHFPFFSLHLPRSVTNPRISAGRRELSRWRSGLRGRENGRKS